MESNTLSLVNDIVGHLVQVHLTEVVAFEELVSLHPRVVCDVEWQLHWRTLVEPNVENIVVFLQNITHNTFTIYLGYAALYVL